MRFAGIGTTVALLVLSSAALGEGRVIITEIMYNPASEEQRGETEWVELANVGDETIQLTDWKLDDEDRAAWGAFSLTLKPGAVLVLVNKKAVSEKAFRAAWDVKSPPDGESDAMDADEETPEAGQTYHVIPVKWASLANSPSAENEILKLLDGEGNVICEVNFQERGDWPVCASPGGASIWLTNLAAADLNDGKLWKRSAQGEGGARACRQTEIFDGADIGSPGFVEGLGEGGIEAPPPTKEEEKATENESKQDDDRIDY